MLRAESGMIILSYSTFWKLLQILFSINIISSSPLISPADSWSNGLVEEYSSPLGGK